MPTIAIASPKGGSGKSTTTIILATELAHAGVPITILDCDPNESIMLWGRKNLPENINLLNNVTETTIIKTIKQNDSDGKLVLIDLEGVASRLVSRAMSQADLVITPMRATTLDAMVGSRAIALISEEEEALNRSIPHAVVFTMTRAIQSKQHRDIEKSLIEQDIDIIFPSLMERSAFSSLFQFGGNLRTIPPQGNMAGAIENAQCFAQEVYKRIRNASHARP